MPTPGEHKTVQSRILEYAQAVGWTFVSREEAEQRRGGIPAPRRSGGHGGQECPLSLFFDDLLDAKVRQFNPRYAEGPGALLGQFRHLHTDIYGNREFVEHLRNRGKFFDHEEKRERDLILIDYDDPTRNVYEVTEEWAFHNGHYGTREDVVFLINGIPVLVIECKNANKDEAIDMCAKKFRLNKADFGLIKTGRDGCYAVGQMVNGLYTDRIGGKRAMTYGAIGTIVLNLLFGLAAWSHVAWVFPLLLIIRSADGYMQAFGAPGFIKVNTAWFRRKERGGFAGIFGAMINLGQAGANQFAKILATGVTIPLLFFTVTVPKGLGTLQATAQFNAP